ncbi:phage tail protein [Nitrosospira briensis]|uniref:phage tail protein n=1 Tax=Nitrosospira briensis TaxID=35799 RepID=UPI00046A9DB6|nr:phage tail protein [Nitrosospira briensis]
MIKVSVKADISKALAKLGNVPKEVMDKAVPRALNKIAAQVKTQTSRSIRDAGYGLKVYVIKKQLYIRRARPGDRLAKVGARSAVVPLIDYGARAVKAGVSVNVKNGRKIIAGAFIATMPNGHKGVFVRTGAGHKLRVKNGMRVWSGLPIRQLYGPSVPAAFVNDIVQAALKRKIIDNFPRIFEHEVRYLSLKR